MSTTAGRNYGAEYSVKKKVAPPSGDATLKTIKNQKAD